LPLRPYMIRGLVRLYQRKKEGKGIKCNPPLESDHYIPFGSGWANGIKSLRLIVNPSRGIFIVGPLS
jgi:hypothetical protein